MAAKMLRLLVLTLSWTALVPLVVTFRRAVARAGSRTGVRSVRPAPSRFPYSRLRRIYP
jgi:hypothetical protein